jgi:hypothetical protein
MTNAYIHGHDPEGNLRLQYHDAILALLPPPTQRPEMGVNAL